MELNDAQKSVVMAMRAGAELVVHRSTGGATLMQNNSAKAVPFDVWRPIYGYDLMRRGPGIDGSTRRVYSLTEYGRTAKVETA